MPRDIEEFLKMAAKRRQQQKKPGGKPAAGRPAAPAGQQQPPVRRTQPTPAPPPAARRAPVAPATDDEIVIIGGTGSADPYEQSVAEHVRSYIDTSSLGEHASHLGEEVALADDKLDSRLHSTFDHQVGHIGSADKSSAFSTTTATTRIDVAPLANDLLNMMSSPRSIQQAVLISEILQRPNFD